MVPSRPYSDSIVGVGAGSRRSRMLHHTGPLPQGMDCHLWATSVLRAPLPFFLSWILSSDDLVLGGKLFHRGFTISNLFFYIISFVLCPSGRFNDFTTIGLASPGIYQKFYIPPAATMVGDILALFDFRTGVFSERLPLHIGGILVSMECS